MDPGWNRAFVALGGNLGPRAETLESALVDLDALEGVQVEAVSGFHRTSPIGGPAGQGEYLNAVARLRVRLTPEALLAELQSIEARHGRDRAREERNGPRTLDLDLIWMDGEQRATPELELPHPRFEDRLFVLEPLEELAPNLRLPRCGVTVAQRVEALQTKDAVR